MKNSKTGPEYRRITFTVSTKHALPVGEQVFISGSELSLGQWQADGLPLTRIDDTVWTGMTEVDASRPIQFKITRGTWETEEYRPGDTPPPNRRLARGGDVCLAFEVSRWIDEADPPDSKPKPSTIT